MAASFRRIPPNPASRELLATSSSYQPVFRIGRFRGQLRVPERQHSGSTDDNSFLIRNPGFAVRQITQGYLHREWSLEWGIRPRRVNTLAGPLHRC